MSNCKMVLIQKPNVYLEAAHKGASKSTFKIFGVDQSEEAVVLLPGGPGLSSTYLDSFATRLSSSSNKTVIVFDYPDHEIYNQHSFVGDKSFSAMTEYLEAGINSLAEDGYKSIILMGHSYGASLVVNLLRRSRILVPVNKSVLLTPVFNGFLSESYKKHASNATYVSGSGFASELSFRQYWAELLPWYFQNPADRQITEAILAGTTWVQNANFASSEITYGDFREIKDRGVYVIAASGDKLVDQDKVQQFEEDLGNRFDVVNSGHFFMLEDEEMSTEHLINFVFTDNRE